jgi:hypothetical protein
MPFKDLICNENVWKDFEHMLEQLMAHFWEQFWKVFYIISEIKNIVAAS